MRLATTALLLVFQAGEALSQEPPSRWTLVPEMRIGAVDDGPYSFDEIRQITISPATGSVFIGGFGEIRAFSSDGRFLRTIGRRGEGPGEFIRLSSLGWVGDTLVALKTHPAHAMRFSEDGRLIEDRSIDIPRGVEVTGRPVAALGPGSYLLRGNPDLASAFSTERPQDPLVRVDRSGGAQLLDQLVQEAKWSLGPVTGPHLLASVSHLAVNSRGTAIAIVHQQPPADHDRGWFRVRRLDGAGRVVYARNYSFVPRAVPSTYADSILRVRAEAVQAIRPIPGLLADLRRVVRVPRFQPTITEVVLSEDGSVWLRREDLNTSSVVWSVLDPRGDLVAELLLPTGQQLLYIDRDVVWGVERDGLDVQYVVRYRLQR